MAALSLKRRSAATEEAHRSRKRPAFDRGTVSYEANGKDKQTGKQILSTGQKAPAQRNLPVTSTKVDHSVITSEDEDEDEAHNEESADLDEDIEDDEMRDGGMVAEKDKLKNGMSARESHKMQKALLSERRAGKQHADILAAAKPLWAKARRKDVPKDERARDVAALMDVVRGRVQDVALKHDASRIVQTIVKYGSQKERDEIAQELKGRYRELAQNKYSKFLVTKLIRTCPRHRTDILTEFRGYVIRLLLHREASSVIADAYELYTNAYERALLLHDFYGREVVLFRPALGKGASADQDERAELKKGLSGALSGADAEKKKRVLTAMKENLGLMLNNSDKGAISHAIFHRTLWEYLAHVGQLEDDELQEKLRRDIFEECQELLAEIVHTKDGSRVVREFVARGTAKDRKQILKVLKPHVERICKDDEAQLVLFTALDVIDDTKLTSKAVVGEITSHANTLYLTAQGRRSLLYLLVPRSPRHFTPSFSAQLAETDPIRAQTSKKDPSVREEEVRQAASGPLLTLVSDPDRLDEFIRDPGGSLLVLEIMLYAEGDKSGPMKTLLQLLRRPYPATGEFPHLIDVPHSCRVYKTLLQGGHYSQRDKRVERVSAGSYNPLSFASLWLATLDCQETRAFGKGGGAFVIAALIECVTVEGSDDDKRTMASWFDEQYRKEVEEGQTKGKHILLDAFSAKARAA